MESVQAVEANIADLERKQAAIVARGRELQDERAGVSYSAHTGDAQARQRLDELNRESAEHASELQSINEALRSARTKLDQARAAESVAADRKRALALRAALKDFAGHARALDDALAIFADQGAALLETLIKMQQLGSVAPSHEQLLALGRRALLAALAETPWRRDFELVEPRLRRSFVELTGVWIAANERTIAAKLGQQKTEEAA
jgi:hypothetical protein